MSSFTARLEVGEHHYPVVRFELALTQPTGPRGQVVGKVRHGHLVVELDVPATDHLISWAFSAHKTLAGALVLLNATGQPQEHIAFKAAYCTHYSEYFQSGDQQQGAYRCRVHITDPAGFILGPGGAPDRYASPAAREHGSPPPAGAAAIPPGRPPKVRDIPTCPPEVLIRLRTQITLMCKTEGTRCGDDDSCPVILAKIAGLRQCIIAREAEMNQCYGGGDAGHKQEVKQRRDGITRCVARYNSKCMPRKPRVPRPVPVPQPSRNPLPLPKPKDLAMPTTVVGAILLFLYIVTAPLRPGPI